MRTRAASYVTAFPIYSLFRSFSSSCPLRTSHFRYVTYSEIAGDLHAQSRFGRGLGFGFGLGLGLGFEP